MKKIKYIIVLLVVTMTGSVSKVYGQYQAYGEGIIAASPFSIGYQYGFSSIKPEHRHAVDVNLVLLLLNVGYRYQINAGGNGYVGLGLGPWIQTQYGFGRGKRLLRIRSDWHLPYDDLGDVMYSPIMIGGFYEHDFTPVSRGNTFGFTLSFNLFGEE